MRKLQMFAPCENFPLYGILSDSIGDLYHVFQVQTTIYVALGDKFLVQVVYQENLHFMSLPVL